MKRASLYLTDNQYSDVLDMIESTVNQEGFRPEGDDCTLSGMKSTTTNCGMCNDGFTTKDTALFPKDFPRRMEMKYREAHHVCPFDRRLLWRKSNQERLGSGCFDHCRIFKPNGKRLTVKDAQQFVAITKRKMKPKLNLN